MPLSLTIPPAGRRPAAWAQQQEPQISPEMQACIDAGIPGEHHSRLDALVGQWSGEYTMYMQPGQPHDALK